MSLLDLNCRPPYRLPLSPGGRRHGWKKDKLDIRDVAFTRIAPAIPTTLDLAATAYMPPVYDQGQLGSCTANGWACLYEFDQRKQKQADFTPSRLQLYYDERVIEGDVNQDAGAQIRDGAKVLVKYGVAAESLWPYTVKKYRTAPSAAAMADAAKHKAVKYAAVSNAAVASLQNALALSYPLVFGTTLYPSFESDAVAASGIVPMPTADDLRAGPIGGHCMVIVGWNTSRQFKVRNSWGAGWGQAGYCWMPFDYLSNTKLASDVWQLDTVTVAGV